MKYLAIILALMAGTASAQDVPGPKEMLIRGGMLCDTEMQLQTLLTGISLNNGQYPEDGVEGCGQFTPRQPIPMTVTPLYWYETPMFSALVAQFHFAPNDWTQFGWVAYVPNPDWKPVEQGNPA